MIIHAPTIRLQDTPHGYLPANSYASAVANLLGLRHIPADRLPFIRDLGFDIQFGEREVLPFPGRRTCP